MFWLLLTGFVLTFILFYIFLGCFVYFDAKVRSDRPVIWTVIALAVPNLIGLLIYYVVGRNKNASAQKVKNKFKYFVAIFSVLTILFAGSSIVYVVTSDNIPIMNHVSIGMVEYNWGNKWKISFKTSGDEFSNNRDLTQDQIDNFAIDGTCDSGNIYILLVQGANAKVIDISNHSGSVDLKEFHDGKIKMMIYNKDARNAKISVSW
jgi:hypothetical protein